MASTSPRRDTKGAVYALIHSSFSSLSRSRGKNQYEHYDKVAAGGHTAVLAKKSRCC